MRAKIVGFVAVLIAVVSFAFTAPRETCADQLYYFQVTTPNLECGAIVGYTDLSLPSESTNPALPNEVTFTTQALNPFGCQSITNIVCAYGYTRTQIELDAVSNKWRPKNVNGVLVTPICCVTKTN